MAEVSSRVLVTGASGYIATHVVQQLLQQGYMVRGTVRSKSNEKKVKPLMNLYPEAKHPLELVEADLMKADGWAEAVVIPLRATAVDGDAFRRARLSVVDKDVGPTITVATD